MSMINFIHRLRLVALPGAVLAIVPLGMIMADAGTTTTGTVVAGVLSATYPLSISLVQATVGGGQVNSALNVNGGAILVSDLRSSGSCGTWTTSATLSNFSDGASHTIASNSVSVTPGSVITAAANPSGTAASSGAGGEFTNPSTAASPTNVVFMSSNGTGCGSFGLNPSFAWTIPANTYAAGGGTVYTATMTFTTQ